MSYLLDTNAVIALLKGHPKLLERMRSEQPADVLLSSVVAHELYFGAFKSGRPGRNVEVVDALRFDIVDFDRRDARIAGHVRAVLQAAGTPVGPYDVLIAGQALARGLTLVTRNLREFRRVEGLRVEDWQGS